MSMCIVVLLPCILASLHAAFLSVHCPYSAHTHPPALCPVVSIHTRHRAPDFASGMGGLGLTPLCPHKYLFAVHHVRCICVLKAAYLLKPLNQMKCNHRFCGLRQRGKHTGRSEAIDTDTKEKGDSCPASRPLWCKHPHHHHTGGGKCPLTVMTDHKFVKQGKSWGSTGGNQKLRWLHWSQG